MKQAEANSGSQAALRAVLSLALLLAAAPLRAQQWTGASPTPAQVIEQVGYDQKLNAQLPLEARFRDESGAEVRLADYFGKRPVVLALVYYECPMLCTLVLNGMVKALKPVPFLPGKEFDVVVVSFDPDETPALAAQKKALYLEEYKKPETAAGWHFLTGTQEEITKLTSAVGFRYVFDPNTGQYAHASGILVATPEGKLYRYFYGLEYSARDLRFALIEASQNKLGTAVDQVMLFCFHYDPTTGKYGVLITRIIRLLGTATVLLVGGFILLSLRREKQKRLSTASAG